jgi:site-specific DNA-methyltransferase (adenine-specific)
MEKKWDASGIAYNVALWKQCFRVLKPGSYLLSFGAPRTYHRMACAIEDAGFEIRDSIHWVYGNGFPKGMNISKQIDKISGATEDAIKWDGWNTALKPAHEPIVMAQKPISEKSIIRNVLKWETGGINIDGCRAGERFPANLIHDGSEEVLAEFAKAGESQGTLHSRGTGIVPGYHGYKYGYDASIGYEDSGTPARFFQECTPDIPSTIYQPKASNSERGGSTHPTIKPLSLIAYLVRMVTPPGGLVLDPFIGSGTLALAAKKEGMHWIGIDLDLTEANTRLNRKD